MRVIRSTVTKDDTLYESYKVYCYQRWAGIARSVWRLATSWTVRGSNSGGDEIFSSRPNRPWGKAAGAWR